MYIQAARSIIVLSLLLLGTACTSNPLQDPVAVRVPQGLTDDQITDAIKDAFVGRGWTIQSAQPGVIESTLYIREHSATLGALYDQSQVELKYVSSTNLDYSESGGERQIHRNYNAWVDNVANDLRAQLSRRAFQ